MLSNDGNKKEKSYVGSDTLAATEFPQIEVKTYGFEFMKWGVDRKASRCRLSQTTAKRMRAELCP